MRLSSSRSTAILHRPQQDFLLWDKAGTRPSLDLQFADRKDLVDAISGQQLITHTRASSGTYVGSDGLIKTATTNLLPRSEEFDQSPWFAPAGVTVTANAEIAPNGTLTADRVEWDAANKGLSQSFTGLNGVSYALSVWVKGAAGETIRFGGNNIAATNYTLTGQWQRLEITGISSSTSLNITINTFAGVTARDLYVWGAQLEQSSTVGEYIPTTSTINSAPRFDHDPETGESLGLLVEEQRSNLLLNSGTLATQDVTVTAVAHALSFYGSGTVALSGTHTATVVGTGAYPARTTLTFTPTAGTLTVTVSGTVEYANLEIGSFATSYIPTEGSTVTRAADVATDTSTGASIRTLYAEFRSPGLGTRPIVSLDDDTANERIELLTSGTDPKLLVTDGGSAVADIDAGTVTANTLAKLAARFATDDYAAAVDGGTLQTDTSGTLPTVDRIRIGSSQAGDYFTGTIARITGWDEELPDTAVEGITQ